MGGKNPTGKLSKLMAYVLGRRPDEFGLVPDASGFIKIKDLLKAVTEEDGWRHVRRSHLDEILLTATDPPIEIRENRIRSKSIPCKPEPVQTEILPKLLYTCIRTRAYPHVAEKGISPSGNDASVILCASPHMAERIGRRADSSPVLLTVHVGKSVTRQVSFFRSGETLFLADHIPVGCFSGPPLPKQKAEPKKQTVQKDPEPAKPAGSFHVDLDTLRQRHLPKGKKKAIDWKKERKRTKRDKDRKQW
jgi:putative RNA 2'-phosphotransferase